MPSTLAGIERITEDYRRAATLAVEAGFDSIEVHVGHNYLLSAFLSPKLNRRDDQFGGSVENRARFARTVLRTVRDAAGPETAVTAKLNMADGVDGGLWLDESVEIASLFESDGALDALELTGGSSLANPMYLFRGDAPLRGVRRHPARRRSASASGSSVTASSGPIPTRRPSSSPSPASSAPRSTTPIILLGGITELATIESALAEGFAFVAMARALLREPDLPEPHAGGHVDVVAVHPLQQVHAHHLFGHALRPGGRPPRFRLGRDRRPARRPRRGLLELPGQREQRLLVAEAADELHADRQALGRSASSQCSGSEIAGWPVTLNGGVNGT